IKSAGTSYWWRDRNLALALSDQSTSLNNTSVSPQMVLFGMLWATMKFCGLHTSRFEDQSECQVRPQGRPLRRVHQPHYSRAISLNTLQCSDRLCPVRVSW